MHNSLLKCYFPTEIEICLESVGRHSQVDARVDDVEVTELFWFAQSHKIYIIVLKLASDFLKEILSVLLLS